MKPRSILKRGILKKPTEVFEDKPKDEAKKDATTTQGEPENEVTALPRSEEPTYGEKREQSTVMQVQPRVEPQMQPQVQPRGGSQHLADTGNLSSKDLEKVNFVLDSFKQQYGLEWDSSKIEAELRMVLERQHLAKGPDRSLDQQAGNRRQDYIPGISTDAPDRPERERESKRYFSVFSLYSFLLDVLFHFI